MDSTTTPSWPRMRSALVFFHLGMQPFSGHGTDERHGSHRDHREQTNLHRKGRPPAKWQ